MKTPVSKLTGSGNIDKASSLLRAFAHPLRIRLLAYIHGKGKINVNKIYSDLKLEQSITSQHLKILRDEKLVLSERDARFIYYSLNYEKIGNIAEVLKSFNAAH